MTANAGYRTFNTGDVLTAAQVQYNLQNQTVMYFATTTARDAALTGSILVEGMCAYTPATGVMVYNGTSWVAVGTASPLTTKGDVWGYSTTNARVPVGADATVLTADSTQALGVKWAAVSSGGMTLLSTTNLTGTATVISSISQSYSNLYILIQNPYVSAADTLLVKTNSTSPALASVFSGSASTASSIGPNLPTTSGAGNQNVAYIVSNYADTSYGKPVFFYGMTGSTQGVVGGGSAQTVSAITSITITTSGGGATFSGGRVLIYGVK